MDLLFKRYASPLVLLDEMLKCGRFSEFVSEVLMMHNEETENETLWDLYLHKVFDKTFDQFKKSIGYSNSQYQNTNEADLEATIRESKNMLDGFVPS